jgi:spore coat protein U-like protein
MSRAGFRAGMAMVLSMMADQALSACGIATAPVNLSFGAYTPITFPGKVASANADSTGSVSISCSGLAQAVSYALKLSAGRGNILARSMGGTGGGADMTYNLYTNASRTTVWGDGASGASFAGSIAPTDGPVTHTFYGRVPAGQSALRAGTFTDQLVITLEYSP